MRNVKVVSFAESPVDAVLIRIPPRVEMIIQRDQLPPAVLSRWQRWLAISSMDGEIEVLGSDVDLAFLRDELRWDVPSKPEIQPPVPVMPAVVEPAPKAAETKIPDDLVGQEIVIKPDESGRIIEDEKIVGSIEPVEAPKTSPDAEQSQRRKKGKR
jgi:hypothetical protein